MKSKSYLEHDLAKLLSSIKAQMHRWPLLKASECIPVSLAGKHGAGCVSIYRPSAELQAALAGVPKNKKYVEIKDRWRNETMDLITQAKTHLAQLGYKIFSEGTDLHIFGFVGVKRLLNTPCPVCGHALVSVNSNQLHYGEGVTAFCESKFCPAQEVSGHGSDAEQALAVIGQKFSSTNNTTAKDKNMAKHAGSAVAAAADLRTAEQECDPTDAYTSAPVEKPKAAAKPKPEKPAKAEKPAKVEKAKAPAKTKPPEPEADATAPAPSKPAKAPAKAKAAKPKVADKKPAKAKSAPKSKAAKADAPQVAAPAFKFKEHYLPKTKNPDAFLPRGQFDKCLWQILEANKFTLDEVKAIMHKQGRTINRSWTAAKIDMWVDTAVADMKAAGIKGSYK